MPRTLWTLLLIPTAAYLGLVVLLWFFQDRLVYYPQIGRELTATPRDYGLDYEAVTLVSGDGEQLDAWFLPPAEGRAVALIFHGNAGNISHRLDTIAMFRRMGHGVLIFDYRGYGRSTGRPSEEGLYQDALAAWDFLVRERGIEPGRVILFGESLGGAVAAWLAAREQPGALLLSSVFVSAPGLAADLYPWLPTRWLVRLRYDTGTALAGVRAPVLVAHSPDDEIIPFRHGQALYAAAPEPRAFLTLAGGHNEGFIFMRPDWVQALAEFLERHLPG